MPTPTCATPLLQAATSKDPYDDEVREVEAESQQKAGLYTGLFCELQEPLLPSPSQALAKPVTKA